MLGMERNEKVWSNPEKKMIKQKPVCEEAQTLDLLDKDLGKLFHMLKH